MPATQPDGYLALPASGSGSPVLVLHAWWGLNDTVKAFCNRLAEAGFVTFALDMYHGEVTDQIDQAERLGGVLDENVDQAKAEISQAVDFLKQLTGADGVAVIGFSLGAFYAFDLSSRAADSIHSVVVFYGSGWADFSKAKAAYLGHFAENDPYEPAENVDELEAEIRNAGRTVSFYRYSDSGHWFFEPDRVDAYNPEAAMLAWERTLAFLKGE